MYKYRYYITGELSDQTSIPTNPLPTSSPANQSYFPFTPYCSLGCLSQGSRANWEGSVASYLSVCDQTITNEPGYNFAYELTNSTDSSLGGLREGVVEPYNETVTTTDDSSSSSHYARSPNVIIFQPDDLYQVYGANWNVPHDPGYNVNYQTATEDTSNIDRIASEGVNFTRAYTASSMCSPSRVALLTGRYPSRGAYALYSEGSDGSQTRITVPRSKMSGIDLEYNLATALRSLNYTTGSFGKWHLTSTESLEAYGCSVSSGDEYSCDYATAQATVRDAGFDVAEGIYITNMNTCGTTCTDSFSHNTEWVTYEAMSFMKDALTSNTSFFAYVVVFERA